MQHHYRSVEVGKSKMNYANIYQIKWFSVNNYRGFRWAVFSRIKFFVENSDICRFYGIFSLDEIRYILPYVLNPLNPLILIHKLMSMVEINNNNINSKLQYFLQNCNFIEDIILWVSAELWISD